MRITELLMFLLLMWAHHCTINFTAMERWELMSLLKEVKINFLKDRWSSTFWWCRVSQVIKIYKAFLWFWSIFQGIYLQLLMDCALIALIDWLYFLICYWTISIYDSSNWHLRLSDFDVHRKHMFNNFWLLKML